MHVLVGPNLTRTSNDIGINGSHIGISWDRKAIYKILGGAQFEDDSDLLAHKDYQVLIS